MSQISIEELKRTPEFRKLTCRQSFFVESYLTTLVQFGESDVKFATRAAYQVSTEESARALGYGLLKNKDIAAVLDLYFKSGQTQSDKDLLRAEKHLAAAAPGSDAAVALLSMIQKLRKQVTAERAKESRER
jgi:hypothetical protein